MSFFAPLLLNRMSAALSNMWAVDYLGGGIYKTDTGTGTITPYLPGLSSAQIVATVFDGTNIWAAGETSTYIHKILPNGTVNSTWIGTTGIKGMAFDGTNIWATDDGSNSVHKISLTGVILNTYSVGTTPRGIAFDGVNMWTANYSGNSVSKITPAGVVTTYSSTGAGPRGIAFDGTNMWTANQTGASVSRIAPDGTITTYAGTGSLPYGIAFNPLDNLMYITNQGSNDISTIPLSGPMNPGIPVYTGAGPRDIAFDGTNMWTANYHGGSITKIPPTGAYTTYTGIGIDGEGPSTIVYDGALLSHWWGGS